MTTGHTKAQVKPRVTDLQAIFATVGAGCYFIDLIEMSAVHKRDYFLFEGDVITTHILAGL